jgi:FkbM family methyltransferase
MRHLFLQRLSAERDSYQRFREAAKRYGVYLYGAGFVGSWSVGYLHELGIHINGFIDSNPKKWGDEVSGVKIYSLTEAKLKNPECILITSRHHVRMVKESISSLAAIKLSVDSFVVHAEGKENISILADLFQHDSQSFNTFYAILLSMLEGETRCLSNYANSRPFFDQFGFFNRDGEIFVDAGAYVGDSLERFIWSVNGVFKHVHAFEPGKKQFEALSMRVDRLLDEWALSTEQIILVNKGISNTSGSLRVAYTEQLVQTRFEPNHRFLAESRTESNVEVVSLDNYFQGDRFTFLKVDIEGSELALLKGATQCIKTFRPRIALSVYHFPTDIFCLLLKCKEINPDYVFFLGHHSSQLMDTVLYCRDRNE